MNKSKLARQHGYYDWDDLLKSADAYKQTKAALVKEVASHAGLVRAAKEAESERIRLKREQAELAAGWRTLAEVYEALAVERDRGADAAAAIAKMYHANAARLEGTAPLPVVARRVEKERVADESQ